MDLLPFAILEQIFWLLSTKDQLICSTTCQAFHRVIQRSTFLRRKIDVKCIRYCPNLQQFKRLFQRSIQLIHLKVEDIPSALHPIIFEQIQDRHFTTLTQVHLSTLSLHPLFSIYQISSKKIILSRFTNKYTKLFYLPNVVSLSLIGYEIDFNPLKSTTNLKNLDLSLTRLEFKDNENFPQFLIMGMKLRNLYLDEVEFSPLEYHLLHYYVLQHLTGLRLNYFKLSQALNEYQDIQRFFRHLRNLKELTLTQISHQSLFPCFLENVEGFQNLTSLSLSPLLKLNRNQFGFWVPPIGRVFTLTTNPDFFHHISSRLTKLIEFHLCFPSCVDRNGLLKGLEKWAGNLEILELRLPKGVDLEQLCICPSKYPKLKKLILFCEDVFDRLSVDVGYDMLEELYIADVKPIPPAILLKFFALNPQLKYLYIGHNACDKIDSQRIDEIQLSAKSQVQIIDLNLLWKDSMIL